MVADHGEPAARARLACTPATIRAVLAANADPEILHRYDADLDAAFERAPPRRIDSPGRYRPPLVVRSRQLPFGAHSQGLVTFLVYPPDGLVLVVKIQWIGG